MKCVERTGRIVDTHSNNKSDLLPYHPSPSLSLSPLSPSLPLSLSPSLPLSLSPSPSSLPLPLVATSLQYEGVFLVTEDYPHGEENIFRTGDRILAVGDTYVRGMSPDSFQELLEVTSILALASGCIIAKLYFEIGQNIRELWPKFKGPGEVK